ncbi:molybdopterin guanine dinucleotide synthesis protein B [Toxoplasma gondii CAST]|uniref:Molybdopterin guanine dinucleotide synthesis protein B n=1 Tax=Toxoplasma gondii CAST TaxID=943122 RepID=A0A3R8B7A9_TOXGO|nr:molybdopterin guanine dinucleotide synthesis protein B [Toxoplasma gondii CAST]
MEDANVLRAPCGDGCWRLRCRELQHADLYHGAEVWWKVPRAQRRRRRTEDNSESMTSGKLAGDSRLGLSTENGALTRGDTAGDGDAPDASAKTKSEDRSGPELRRDGDDDEDEQVIFMPRVFQAVCGAFVRHGGGGGNPASQETTREGGRDREGRNRDQTEKRDCTQLLPSPYSVSQPECVEAKAEAGRKTGFLGTVGDGNGESETRRTGGEQRAHQDGDKQEGLQRISSEGDLHPLAFEVPCSSSRRSDEGDSEKLRDGQSRRPSSSRALAPSEPSSGPSAVSTSVVSPSSAPSLSDVCSNPCCASFLTPLSNLSPSSASGYLSCSSPCGTSSPPQSASSPCCPDAGRDVSCLSANKQKESNEESALPSPRIPSSSSDSALQQGSSCVPSCFAAQAAPTSSEKMQKNDASGTTQASIWPSPPGPSTRMYILPMARGEWVRVDSTIWFRVLRGTAEVRGHLFPPSRDYQLVSCPVWSPTVRILAVGAPGTASARLRRACAKTPGGPTNECQDAEVTAGASRNALEAEVSRLPATPRAVTTQAASDAVSATHAGAEEGQSDFGNARDRCACSQLEKQFVEFTGGDAEAVSSLFTASVDSLPRRFLSGPRGGGATASAKTVGPALRRLLQVDEKLRVEVVPSVEVGEALKRISKKRYPVVLCFAQMDTPCGSVPIHSAVEPPAPVCLYRPLEILPPSWRYVAFELLRIFASEESPSLLPIFSASRPGIKWICSPCLSERSSACIPEETYRQCANGQRRLPVAVLWGSKGAGKSTFSYFLLNFLLNFFPRVAYLEADVGQPTFTLPGCVSLLEVSEPLLTPPHMLVDSLDVSTLQGASPVGEGRRNKLMENLFFGDISPKSAPHLYLRCISRCISTYCEHIQGDRRSALRSGSAPVSTASSGAFSYPSSVSVAASLVSSASAQPARSAVSSFSSSCLCPSSPVVSESFVSPSPPAVSSSSSVSSSPSVSSFAAKSGLGSVASAATSNRQNRAKHTAGKFAWVPPTVPLVVNTPGWVEGLGESLLSSIQAMSKASACIQFFDSPNKEEDLGERVSCGTDDVQCEEGRARRETADRLVEARKSEASNERGAKSEENSRKEATAREACMADSTVTPDGCDGRSRGAAVNIKQQRGGDRLEVGEGAEDCLPHDEEREGGQWRKRARDSERTRGERKGDETNRYKRKRDDDVEFSANGEPEGEGSVRRGSGHPAFKQGAASLSGNRIASQAREDREEPGGSAQASQENSTCPSKRERQADVLDAAPNPNNGLSRSPSPRFSSSRSATHVFSSRRTSLASSPSSSASSAASSSSASSTLGRRLPPARDPLDASSLASFPARLQRLCSRSFPASFSHRILLHPCRALSPASSSADRPGLAPRVVACPYMHAAAAEERERGRERPSQQGDRGSALDSEATRSRGPGKTSASSSVRVCECCGKGAERRDCRSGDSSVSDARPERMQQSRLKASTKNGGDTCDSRRGRKASANPQVLSTQGRRVRVSVPEILECIQSVEHPNASPLAAHPLFAADASNACGCGVHIFSVPSFKQHLLYLHQSSLSSSSTQLPLPSSPRPSPFSRERGRGSPFVSGLLPLSFNTSFNLETGRRYRRVYDEVVSASSEDDEAGAAPHASPVGTGNGTRPTRGERRNEERRGRKHVRTPRAEEEETEVDCRDEDEDIDTESGPKTDGEDETVRRGRNEEEKKRKDLEAKTKATMRAGERQEAAKEGQGESYALPGEHETAGMDASKSEALRMKWKEASEERPVVGLKESDSGPEQRTDGAREELLRATGEGKEKLENPSIPDALEWRRQAVPETRERCSSSRSQQVEFRVPRVPLEPVSVCPRGRCFSSAPLSASSSSCSRFTSPGPSPPASPLAVSCSCRSPAHLFPRCVDPFERPPAPSPAELRWLRLLSHFLPSSRSLLFRSGLPRFSWESLCSFFLTFQDTNTELGCLSLERTRSEGHGALCPTAEEEQEEVSVRRGVGDEVAESEEAKNVEPNLEGDSRKNGEREAAGCLSKAQILCASSLLPLESSFDASLSRASASPPARFPPGLSAGRCAETRKRKADGLAVPRPTARKWVWISLEKIQIALRECDALLVGCGDATGGVREHLCSASATEKILSCLPAMTVALAISGEREKHNLKRSIPPVAALCTEMMPKSRSEGPSSFRKGRKPCRLKVVEATENFTCVCYAVVMRVNRRSDKLLCLIGGSASLLGDIVKRVDTLMLGEGIHFNPCPPEASHTSKNSDSLKKRQIHCGKTGHIPTPFYAFPFRTVDLRSLSFSQFPSLENWGRTAGMSEANEPDELSISRPKIDIPAFDLICQSSRGLFRGTELLDLGNSGKMSAAFFSRNGTPFRSYGQSSRAHGDMNDRSGMKHSDRHTGGDMSTLVRDARTGDTPLSAAFDTAGFECRNQVTTRVISSKAAVRRPGRSAGVRQGLAR